MRPGWWFPKKRSGLVRWTFALSALTIASVSAGLAGEGGSHGGGHSSGHHGSGHSGNYGTGHAGGNGGGHASSGYGYHPFGHHRAFRDGFVRPYLGLGAYYGAPRTYYPSNYAYASDVGYVDLDVYPVEAEVYLDGQYIGTAVELDGFPGSLQVSPGRHTLEFGLEGFLTSRVDLNVRPGATLSIPRNLRPSGPSGRRY